MALPTTLKSHYDIVSLLEQSEEWAALWGNQVFLVISGYNYTKPEAQSAYSEEDSISSDEEPLMKRTKAMTMDEEH
jgi:hypothetical protein